LILNPVFHAGLNPEITMSKYETATRAVVTVALILIGLALSVSGVKLGIDSLLLAVVLMLAAMAINRREWRP
jgi:hypothetical protein